MAQIKNRRYDEALRENGRCEILAYGIAFHKNGAGWYARGYETRRYKTMILPMLN